MHIAPAAVIAAAGFSRRMGRFKQLLPWGDSTVVVATAQNLAAAGATPVVCVVGYRGDEVATEVKATLPPPEGQIVYNSRYEHGEMLSSFQAGVEFLQGRSVAEAQGCILSLGDQPHVPVGVIEEIVHQVRRTPERIVIPSFERRRGHPIYLPRLLWPDLLTLDGAESPEPETLRTLIVRHDERITYVNVATDAILRDMDTPSDYEKLKSEQVKGQ